MKSNLPQVEYNTQLLKCLIRLYALLQDHRINFSEVKDHEWDLRELVVRVLKREVAKSQKKVVISKPKAKAEKE